MTESEAITRKKRIDAKLGSALLNWKIIHHDKVRDTSLLDHHAVEAIEKNLCSGKKQMLLAMAAQTVSAISAFETPEDPNSLPEPQVLAADAITELNACVDELQEILTLIEAEDME